MTRILDKAHLISRVLVWVAGTMIIASALLVTAEVILRKLFNISFGGADELSGYAFGIATTFGFAYALFERAHIRVDALYNLFPPAMKVAANFMGLLLLTGFVGVTCVIAWGLVADTVAHNSHSITPMRTPLAIPQIAWLAGWLFFLICGILLLLAAAKAVLSGDVNEANRLIGTKSIDEQIEDEAV